MRKPKPLTGRQSEVLDAIIKHGTSKLAARELGLSYRTVETHIQQIVKRMGVQHRLQAVLAHDRATREREEI